ncbi:germination protein YpeB [Siminovitchia acidinfaciens]|uniref:Germination protein YpeB n=1 Tax=Siminovitchia acidinfaciens TaxID=2321395 RepID=A0A429XY62_9BACI|nr:germination protein YpeB [Siminovitchia acidinfaciens]RST73676.1 germination protein YpeB [Siminovitchia acidinfaciens]
MIRNILVVLLAVAAIGAGAWGYQEHQEKNTILINAENNYQRAFHDLSYQMDLLNEKLGGTIAMNSSKSLSPALADVWRITSEARSQVGQLPLTLLPFNKTEEFLSNIGTFSYRTAIRNLDEEPLSKEEQKTLKNLYKQSGEIRNELRKVQHLALKNNLRWMDVDLALASGKETADNTIIDGFKTVEKQATGYDEKNLQNPSIVSFQKRDENYERLKGEKVSKKDAISLAQKYSGIKQPEIVEVTESRKGSSYGFYNVVLVNGKGHEATMDITKKGGYPIWFIDSREVKQQQISLNEAMNKADEFLKRHDYKQLEMAESMQYDSVGLFTYVTTQNGVRIYPESIKVKVALDNGQIVGFAADDYLKSSNKRNLPEPKITLEEAKANLNPHLKVMEDRKAVIVNDLGNEVLCYEILGTMDHGDTYRIYINAESGFEEKVDKLKNAEPVYEDLL